MSINVVLLFRFFIGYWILKTGLDFYPGPIFFVVPEGWITALLLHDFFELHETPVRPALPISI